MKIESIVDTFIPGDWGQEKYSAETPNSVFCVRGADIVPIQTNNFNDIPQRYVSNKTIESKLLKAGDIVIEKSGGSPVQSTGRVVYISEELIKEKGNLVCSNFCVAFRVKEEWNPFFIYQYWLNIYNAGVFFNFEGKTSGIKNLQLNNALSTIEIEHYGIAEQLRISEILSSLEQKISINRRINHNLRTLDRSSKEVEVRRAA